jgi:alpha,alpha-trehalase
MNRRKLLAGAAGTLVMSRNAFSALSARAIDLPSRDTTFNESQWAVLDTKIRSGWAADTSAATEAEIRGDTSKQLLFLPFPYVSPTAPGSIYHFMFAWDTDFISRALIAHEALDQVRNHVLNYLFMIDRYGYMPNANAADSTTRSQTPLIADTTWRYYLKTKDRDLLYQSYPRLKRNYRDYWGAHHHQTPTGLATNRDLGDPALPPHLAAEAEVGLDWTPIFGGDVRRYELRSRSLCAQARGHRPHTRPGCGSSLVCRGRLAQSRTA